MAEVLHVITVLIVAFTIPQESTEMPASTKTQPTTETRHPSTASTSTHSSFMNNSHSTVTSASKETHEANRASPEPSIHRTSTSSQSHTVSLGEKTTTNQTKTTSVVSNSNRTTSIKLTSGPTILSSTEESGKTAASTEKMNTSPSSGSSNKGDILAMNPGLVAILCIFFIVLALVIGVAIAKIISSQCQKGSQFERLDDLPMNKMNEDAPFARYPPK